MIESFKLPIITPETLTGSICSFKDEYGGLPLKSCTSLITGYQEGSGTPSPSNVRPLHAFSSGTLNKTGKNLFDVNSGNVLNAYINTVDGVKRLVSGAKFRTVYSVCKPNETYTVSRIAGTRFSIGYTSSIPEIGIEVKNNINSQTGEDTELTITTSNDAKFIVAYVYNENSDTKTASEILNSIQIEIGQEATAYEPFGNTYTFSFGQSIYQGSIDWKRGVAVGTWGYIASYNGETLTGEWLCNKAPYEAGTTPPTGSQVAYELATPIEIPLGGINLLTQEGQNNIFADCGDTTLEFLKVN